MLSTLIILSLAILTTLLISVSFIAKAQYNRAKRYEKMLGDYDAILDEFGKDVLTTYQHMKTIDDQKWFESEDDVGEVFRDLVKLIEKFNERTQEKLER